MKTDYEKIHYSNREAGLRGIIELARALNVSREHLSRVMHSSKPSELRERAEALLAEKREADPLRPQKDALDAVCAKAADFLAALKRARTKERREAVRTEARATVPAEFAMACAELSQRDSRLGATLPWRKAMQPFFNAFATRRGRGGRTVIKLSRGPGAPPDDAVRLAGELRAQSAEVRDWVFSFLHSEIQAWVAASGLGTGRDR